MAEHHVMRTIAEVMTQPVVTARSDQLLGPVKQSMLEGHFGCVPVVSAGGELQGIVTSTDAMEQWDENQVVGTVMSAPVMTAEPSMTTVAAARLMLDNRLHHIVVVDADDEDKVAGVLSSFDLLRDLADEVEATAAEERFTPGRHAGVGDTILIRGHRLGDRERRGVVAEVLGDDGGPPYIVHWLDDSHDPPHDVLFFPGTDADFEPRCQA